MNDKNMTVLTNVIGAVESGGQIYGKRNYAAYAAPYANSSIEYTITLGWAQNYGAEAEKLISMILEKDPGTFRKLDTAGIEKMLEKDWVKTRWNPAAAQKKVLIALIDSAAGHKAQDELFAELMETFIASCEKDYTADVKAIMMYCEIRHLGGKGPADRIFKRCAGNYSLDNIMAALKKDQADKTNNNQVGDAKFWTRHQKCREFIEKYAVDESGTSAVSTSSSKQTATASTSGKEIVTTSQEEKVMSKTAEALLTQARAWIGCKESDGSHKKIIDVYNYHKPLARSYKVKYTDAWCATFVSACAIKTGMTDIIPTECGCGEMVRLFQKLGEWDENDARVPNPGDIIFYDWQDSGSGDNTGNPDHVGIVEKVSGSTITVIEGNYSDSVKRRTLRVNGRYIRGYGVPKYENATPNTATTPASDNTVNNTAVKKVSTTSYASKRDDSLAGTYITTANLYCRNDASTKSKALCIIPKGTEVKNYGFYSVDDSTGRKWLLIQFTLKNIQYTGFSSIYYLEKK